MVQFFAIDAAKKKQTNTTAAAEGSFLAYIWNTFLGDDGLYLGGMRKNCI